MPLVQAGLVNINKETDPALARLAIPSNLELIESLAAEDPANDQLKIDAAMGLYGYAFGFIEDQDPRQASLLYQRGLDYARSALLHEGLTENILTATLPRLQVGVARLNKKAVPALFWTAACWAKWIDMNRNNPERLAELSKVVVLMRRARVLDERYYYGGADLFFGVFYGSRPPDLGGDLARSACYFARARAITHGRLLIVDVLRAQYLLRQQGNRKGFQKTLMHVVHTSSDLYPAMALSNAIAQQKARRLLRKGFSGGD